jgi:hypothetical protein
MNAAKYQILLSENCSPSERFASKELSQFFQMATGVRLNTLEEKKGERLEQDCRYISIGDTALFKATNEVLDYEALGMDGVRVFTRDGNVFLNAISLSGRIYAVYEFLKRQFAFTVYADDEIYIEKTEQFVLKEMDVISRPDFDGRDIHGIDVVRNPILAVRLRANDISTPFTEEHGEGSPWATSCWCHSTFLILPPEKYLAEHPEWYTDNQKQICIATALEDTEEGRLMYQTFLENFKTIIANDSKKKYFMIGQEDVGWTCQREKSLAMDKKYGGEQSACSGTLMVFVNKIAREVKAWLKETAPERAELVKIVIFAYQKTQQPPVTWNEQLGKYECVPEVVPEENVMVRFAPLASVYSKDFLDEEYNLPARTSILGWSDIGAKLSVWNYGVGFGSYEYPIYHWPVLQKNYKIFKKYGVKDILAQGPKDTKSTPFMAMQSYILSNLLWNVDVDMEFLIKDFMSHYYKEAAKYIYRYFEYINAYYKTIEITKGFLSYAGVWESEDMAIVQYYSKEFLEESLKILRKAKQLAMEIQDEEKRKIVLNRVRVEELSPRYMMLDLYRRHFDKKECEGMINDFVADAKELGLINYKEGGDLATIEARAESWKKDLQFGTPLKWCEIKKFND